MSLRSVHRSLQMEYCEARRVLAGVPELIEINPTGASDPRDFVRIEDTVYFTAIDGTRGRELWRTDGTPAGTSLVRDIRAGSEGSDPTDLVVMDGFVYFAADDGEVGRELWRSDGTESGTVLVRDLRPGEGYQYPYGEGLLRGNPEGLVNINGTLLFAAGDTENGRELWSSDGTQSGTAMVRDIAPGTFTNSFGTYPNASDPEQLTVIGGTLYFTADDGTTGRELWKSDGTAGGTVLVKDIFTGTYPYYYDGTYYGQYPNASRPGQLTVFDGQLYFAATDGDNGRELWKSDGTADGTVLVKDIEPGAESGLSEDNWLLAANGRLYFAGETSDEGKELWSSDGTEAGTALVRDLRPGTVGSISDGYLTAFDGEIFFAADDGVTGTDLWKSDGTSAGTVLVRNLDGGSGSSLPRYLTEVNGRLYFTALVQEAGRELWESDGTAAGTVQVADLNPGLASSSPRELFALDQLLLFSADNGTAGRELFRVAAVSEVREASLIIYVDGQRVTIPDNVGVDASDNALSVITTADANGSLRIEPIGNAAPELVTLDDFFQTWRTNAGAVGNNADATFGRNELMGNLADADNAVQMFVNGQVSHAFEDYPIEDGDQIILVYGENPVVSLNTNFGSLVFELFSEQTPITVNNFLNYVNDGDYLNSFIHRSDPDFVIQGGGFRTNSVTFTGVSQFTNVPTDGTIQNEPGISNLRGTVAMAKVGSDPNSATSQFFVNLGDNSFLDLPQNNEFTVFAQVLDMATPDRIAALPINTSNSAPYGELPLSANNELVVVQSIAGVGYISGTKYLDANSNGLLDSGESPLAGVVVFVDDNENGVLDTGETSTTTDAAGFYRLQLEPGMHLIRAEVGEGRFATEPSGGDGYEITIEIGREFEDRDFGEADLAAPTSLDLIADFDTGSANDDNLTNRNNASATATLEFLVNGVIDGATVELLADSVVIGSATADNGIARITTNGTLTLADGTRAFTARQIVEDAQSELSTPLEIQIDTTLPAGIGSTPPAVVTFDQAYTFDADSPDEGQVTYSLVGAPTGMTIDGATGALTWTPTIQQTGPQSFQIAITDAAGNTVAEDVQVTVLGEIPALPDAYSLDEDDALTVNAAGGVLANDGDNTTGQLTATLVDDVTNGTLTFNADGSFSYTPDPDFFGTDRFTYRASDGTSDTNVAQVVLEVQQVDDPIVPAEDSYTTAEDTVLTVQAANGVLANDVDPDNDPLTASLANQPTSGTLQLNADGSFTYTPNQDFSGSDSFAYRVTDGTNTSDPVSVAITVTAVNDAPRVTNDLYSVNEDATLTIDAAAGVLANDEDPDSASLVVTVGNPPDHGSLTLNADGSFTYTPDADFVGTDQFTYRVNDGELNATGSVMIDVLDQPDPPQAVDDTVTAADDGSSQTFDVLANDLIAPDVDDQLALDSVTQGSAGGTVAIQDNRVTYAAPVGFTGTDTFTYTVRDQDGLTDTATVTVNVSDSAGNRLGGFVFLDTDGDGQRDSGESGIPGSLITLRGTSSTGTEIERAVISDDNGFYEFANLQAGTYALIQQQPTALDDGQDSTNVPNATVANDQITGIVISGSQSFTENNFAETQLHPAYISISWFFASSTNTAVVFRETMAMSEESAGNMELADAIRNEGEVPPPVENVAPIASPDNYTVAEASTLTVPAATGVLGNDIDADGDSLTAALVNTTSNGTLTLNADGSFVYAPNAGFVGNDSFSYVASDGTAQSTTVTVTITVTDLANTFAVNENSPVGTLVGRVDFGSSAGTLSYAIEDQTLPERLLLRPDDHLHGDPDAPIVLIEYLDLQCPICLRFQPIIKELEDEFSEELLIVTRHFPVEVPHPNAFEAAVSAEAAGRQGKFREMVDLMYEKQDEWDDQSDPTPLFEDYAEQLELNLTQYRQDIADPDLAARVQRDLDDAVALGATGAPTFFLEGERLNNTEAEADFESLIEDALDEFDQPFLVNRVTGDILVADGSQLNFEANPTFTFDVVGRNLAGQVSRQSVTINLINVNESAPVAFADSYTVADDQTLTVNESTGLLANDTDADGDALTAELVNDVQNGTLALNANGSFTYTPVAGFTGTDSFTYRASDGAQVSNTATVTIAVESDNVAPQSVADNYTTQENTTLTVAAATGVLANDTDADGDTLTAQLVTSTTNGTLTFNADGSFTYVPTSGFGGSDSFTYQARDASLISSTTTVTITVTAVNQLPQAVDDSYVTVTGGTLEVGTENGVLDNDVDPDGDSLTATLVTDVANGTLTFNADGSFTFVPPVGFSGTETFVYRANDADGSSNDATVTLTVNAANTFSLFEDAADGTVVGSLQLGSQDLDGALIFEEVDATLDQRLWLAPDDHLSGDLAAPLVLIEYLDLQCPTCAAVHPVIEQLESEYAGQLLVVRRHFPLLQPHPNAFDAAVAAEAAARQDRFDEYVDLLFTNQTEWADEANPLPFFEGYANDLDLNLTQFSADLNDTALAARVQRDLDAALGLGASATPTFYLDGDRIAQLPDDVQGYRDLIDAELAQITSPFSVNRRTGQVVVTNSSALDFDVTPTFTLSIRAEDLDGDSETIQAVINLINVNQDPPVSVADTYSTTEEVPLVVDAAAGILANDSDPDGDPLVPRIDTNPANGNLSLSLDGSFTYTPNPNFSGQDQFVYQASDGDFLSSLTTVTIQVVGVNDAPQAVDIAYSTSENTILQVTANDGVLSNDVDVDGDALTANLVNSTTNGTLTLNADGSFTYNPNASFSGTDTFTYRVNDGTVDSAQTATVTIVVTDVNQAPVANPDSYVAQADQVLQVAAATGLLANDNDPDGDVIRVVASTKPVNGEVLVGNDGTFQYTPDAGFTGTDTFQYRVTDEELESPNVTVTVIVNPPNTFSVEEGTPQGASVGTVQSQSAELNAPLVMELADATRPDALGLVPDDHLSGDVTAPVVLIEYLDFECPTCRAFHPVVNNLEGQFDGELLVVRRHFPLTSVHPNAFAAGVAAEAAARQNAFDAFGDLLFDNQPEWAGQPDPQPFFDSYASSLGLNLDQFRNDQADSALTARVQRDLDAIGPLGGTGTPTFFLQGTRLTSLPATQDAFAALIQAEVDAVDDVFRLNRLTGELTVRAAAALDFETNPQFTVPVAIRDQDGDVESVTVTVNLIDVAESSQGAVLSAPAIDLALADDLDWSLV